MTRKKVKKLSAELPTEQELAEYPALMCAESDRGAAIMGGALVEQALALAIRSRLADPEGDVASSWFDGPTAAFGTFAAKITLGRALGIYGEGMQGRLSLIKDIRNAFAHRSRPLDFDHEALAVLRAELMPDPADHADKSPRVIFSASCLSLATVLIKNAYKHGGKEIEVDFP